MIWREGKVAGLRKRELLDWGRGEGTVVFLECLNTQILMAEHVEGFYIGAGEQGQLGVPHYMTAGEATAGGGEGRMLVQDPVCLHLSPSCPAKAK